MTDHVYKIEEFVGSSPIGQDEAIRNAIKRAAETLHRLRWFEVSRKLGAESRTAVSCIGELRCASVRRFERAFSRRPAR